MKNNLTYKQTERIIWFVAVKGLGIIMVVMGHLPINDYLKALVYLFHMPLFFIVSGFLYSFDQSKSSIRAFIIKRIKSLLYPYVTFGIIYIVFEDCILVSTQCFSFSFLNKQVLAFLYGSYIWENNYQYIGVLWFLLALFFVTVICKILDTRLRKTGLLVACTVLISLLGAGLIILLKHYNIRLPFCIDIALAVCGFYGIGVLLGRNNLIKSIKNSMLLLSVGCLALVGGCCSYVNTLYVFRANGTLKTDMLTLNFGIFPLYFISAVCISVMMMILVFSFSKKCQFRVLRWMGKNSILIMVVHLKILTVLNIVSGKLNISVNPYMMALILLFLSCLVAAFINKYLRFLYQYPKKGFKTTV